MQPWHPERYRHLMFDPDMERHGSIEMWWFQEIYRRYAPSCGCQPVQGNEQKHHFCDRVLSLWCYIAMICVLSNVIYLQRRSLILNCLNVRVFIMD